MEQPSLTTPCLPLPVKSSQGWGDRRRYTLDLGYIRIDLELKNHGNKTPKGTLGERVSREMEHTRYDLSFFEDSCYGFSFFFWRASHVQV